MYGIANNITTFTHTEFKLDHRWHTELIKSQTTHLLNDSSLDQARLLGGHDKIVSLIFIVDDVLQRYSKLLCHRVEEFLTIDVRHAANLGDG